jgi:hypothetical protein
MLLPDTSIREELDINSIDWLNFLVISRWNIWYRNTKIQL